MPKYEFYDTKAAPVAADILPSGFLNFYEASNPVITLTLTPIQETIEE